MTLNSDTSEGIFRFILLIFPVGIATGISAALVARRLAQASRPAFLPMIAVSLLLDGWAASMVPSLILFAVSCALCWALLVLSAVDAEAFRLPDVVTLPLLAAGLAVSWFLPDRDLVGHGIGALGGMASFYAVAEVYRRTRGREGLGLGDVKLAGVAGAWLGWQALPSTVLLASCAGLILVGLSVLRRGKAAVRERIPFGVALCAAIWIVWLYGPLELFGS